MPTETVVYYPGDGYPRIVNAVIQRSPPSKIGDINAPVYDAAVIVRNDATYGISSTEINLGKDRIAYAERYGKAAITRSVTRIVEHDRHMMTLEVR